jgi:hypothetical protein
VISARSEAPHVESLPTRASTEEKYPLDDVDTQPRASSDEAGQTEAEARRSPQKARAEAAASMAELVSGRGLLCRMCARALSLSVSLAHSFPLSLVRTAAAALAVVIALAPTHGVRPQNLPGEAESRVAMFIYMGLSARVGAKTYLVCRDTLGA